MSLQLTPELAATVQGFLAGGRYKDDEDVLREALVALQYKENIAGIQEGVDDWHAGRYRALEEVDAEMRKKYGLGQP
jgi:Arc/MetJ-type ribon-helix-helix transcriptional regulator